MLRRLAEKSLGMTHEILVQGIVRRHEEAEGAPAPSAAASCLLPQASYAPRVARHHRRLQVTDIDAQLQGAGGSHPKELTFEQGLLYPAPLLGHVATAVGGNPGRQRGLALRQAVASHLEKKLYLSPAPGEGDAPQTTDHQLLEDGGRLASRTAAD